MIEHIDWPSFGYGAGVIAATELFYYYQHEVTGWVRGRLSSWRERRGRRQARREEDILRLLKMATELHTLDRATAKWAAEKVAFQQEKDHLHAQLVKLTTQDRAWENYERRKKGLPVLPASVSGKPAWMGVPCTCGHGSRQHFLGDPERCSVCECPGFTAHVPTVLLGP